MKKDKKKFLIIVAHCDDAELMYGGLISNLVRKGNTVDVLVVTDGSAWAPCFEGKNIFCVRQKEQAESAKVLGVNSCHYLKLKDGFVKASQLEMPLLKKIREIDPNVILTHSANEKHNDHREVYLCLKRLCNLIDEPAPIINPFIDVGINPVRKFLGLYSFARIEDINNPNLYFYPIEEIDIQQKMTAIEKFQSQGDIACLGEKIYNQAKFYGGLVGCNYAELLCKETQPRYKLLEDF